MTRLTPAAAAGIAAGLLFFGHALINNSHAWPLIWPALGGAAAVAWAARRHRLHGFWSGLGAGAGAGAVAGVLFFAGSVAALWTLSRLGWIGDVQVTPKLLILLGLTGAGGMALAVAAAGLTFPFARAVGRRA